MDYRSGTHTIGKVRQAAEYAYTEFGYDYTTATQLANQFVNAVISDDCIDEYDENTSLSNRAITNVCYDMFSTDEQEKYFYDILWGY